MKPLTTHAVIMLAGYGARLKPLTDETHKSLLPVGSETFLKRLLRQLTKHGVQNVHLALGYRSTDVKKYVEHHFPHLNVTFHNNPKYQTTNNAYSLHLVMSEFKKVPSFFLFDGDVMLSDTLVDKIFQNTEKNFIVCDLQKDRLTDEAMKCLINERSEVILLSKKIPLAKAHGESIGVACFQKDWLTAIQSSLIKNMQDPEKQKTWYYEHILVDMLSKAPSPLGCVTTNDLPWIEVDTLEDYQEARKMFGAGT